MKKKLLQAILGRKFVCKYIEKKHRYDYRSTYMEGRKPYQVKIHVNSCENCASVKRVVG